MDFPVADFRKLLEIGQGYPTDTRVKPVLGGPKPEPGLSSEDLLRIKLAPVRDTIVEVFGPDGRLQPGHWLFWMGCEIGMKRIINRRGLPEFVFHDPDGFFPMSDIAAAFYYNTPIPWARTYHIQARTAVLDAYYRHAFLLR